MYLIKNHPIKASEGRNVPEAQCAFSLGTEGRSTKTNRKDGKPKMKSELK
jgi:hypothetical protein